MLVEVGEIESPSEVRIGKTLQAYPISFLAEVYEIGKISPRSHYFVQCNSANAGRNARFLAVGALSR